MCSGARLLLRARLEHRKGSERRRVLIVGAGEVGQRLARSLQAASWVGLEVVGYLARNRAHAQEQPLDHPVLGTLEDLSQVITQLDIQELILASSADWGCDSRQSHRLANLLAELKGLVSIKAVPDLADLTLYGGRVEECGGIPLVGLYEPAMGPLDRLIKRAIDLGASLLGLILLSPLFGIIALAVKLSSPGSILYHSLRVGERGAPFQMLKFRTMYAGADQDEARLICETADGKLLFAKRSDDPRVTPVGKILRRYSLDELPQLWNVLIGQMSLVGPRPELPSLVAHYQPWQRQRLSVPQGITGWWQISGRSSKAKHLHVEDDLYYIRNYSLFLDWHILWRTLGVVIRGEGAF
jgi:exopolysaccharide biosynthesis polyprenyl glycosylphosphotransferase